MPPVRAQEVGRDRGQVSVGGGRGARRRGQVPLAPEGARAAGRGREALRGQPQRRVPLADEGRRDAHRRAVGAPGVSRPRRGGRLRSSY